jgi:hypothetical protein
MSPKNMENAWRVSVCVLATYILFIGSAEAVHRPALKCAEPEEAAAIQTTVVDQQLVDAALTCGDVIRSKFNAYRTAFGPELRLSDRALLNLFIRVYGSTKGDAAYNLFKTNMASKAELRRIRDASGFCRSADLVLAAAIAPEKPRLKDFVSGVPISASTTPEHSPSTVSTSATPTRACWYGRSWRHRPMCAAARWKATMRERRPARPSVSASVQTF